MRAKPSGVALDMIVHCIVAVVFIVAVAVLGVFDVLDGAGVVSLLLGGGGIVGALTISDRVSYSEKEKA